ncbi:hypothetical protein BDP27DRAFT_1440162 [Rhodocollybia butyracea]|uniref:Uncharacterized protein n=1 Tax=Rhodocollybia butyracea TaxID=206335 RepID=A0A9P5TVM1_9AGAR|nr:hypothetical protein BDP27DRAFT_1440162 [Rhodocollybia butyracea]
MFVRKLSPKAGTSTLSPKLSLLNDRHVSTATETRSKLLFKSPKIRPPTSNLFPDFLNPRYASTSTASELILPDPEQETDKSPVTFRFPSSYGRDFSKTQNISTLDPSRLVASDFIDCKDQWHLSVRYRRISVIFCRYSRVPDTAFPPGTRGYLYLHRPDGIHPCAATLRFRICDRRLPPQESFARGKDLLSYTGAPWELTMLKLFILECIRNFREGLLHDKMMSLEAIEQMDKLVDVVVEEGKKGQKIRSKLVFSFGQSFSIPMGQLTSTFNFVNLETGRLEHGTVRTRIAKCTDRTLSYTLRIEYNPHTNIASRYGFYTSKKAPRQNAL